MKWCSYLVAGISVVMLLLPGGAPGASAPGKKQPPAPITYAGDTEATISRRAQWVEGAKKEGTLVWWGSLTPTEANEIIGRFNKVYPFIKFTYWRARGEEVGSKLEQDFKGRLNTPDVILGGSVYNYPRWAQMGIIDKFTNIVPGIEKFDSRMYGKRGDWVMPGFAPKIPQYNTNLVSAAEVPKSLEDLLDHKWYGQLGAETDAQDWASLALCEGGWGIEKTEHFLTKLKEQKPRFINGGSAAHALLIAGDFKIMALGNLRHVLISQEKKAPVDWARVSPILVTGTTFALLKKAPHPDAAKLFLEWQLSHPGLAVWAEVNQNYVPGVPSQMSKLLEGMPLLVRTEEVAIKLVDSGLDKKFSTLLFGVAD